MELMNWCHYVRWHSEPSDYLVKKGAVDGEMDYERLLYEPKKLGSTEAIDITRVVVQTAASYRLPRAP